MFLVFEENRESGLGGMSVAVVREDSWEVQ